MSRGPASSNAITPSAIKIRIRLRRVSFGILAVAYFGVKFVLEDLLGRHWG